METPKQMTDKAAHQAISAMLNVYSIPDEVIGRMPGPVYDLWANTYRDLQRLSMAMVKMGESMPDPIKDVQEMM